MDSLLFAIEGDGKVTAIYNDALAGLLEEGQSHVTRASHVEPSPDGGWVADLCPVGGPVLGPYRLRQDALDAEVAWLEKALF